MFLNEEIRKAYLDEGKANDSKSYLSPFFSSPSLFLLNNLTSTHNQAQQHSDIHSQLTFTFSLTTYRMANFTQQPMASQLALDDFQSRTGTEFNALHLELQRFQHRFEETSKKVESLCVLVPQMGLAIDTLRSEMISDEYSSGVEKT